MSVALGIGASSAMFAVVDALLIRPLPYTVLQQVVGDIRRPLWILLGAVGFLLLVGCATPARIRTWVLGQAFALSVAGGIAGVAGAGVLARMMRGFMP